MINKFLFSLLSICGICISSIAQTTLTGVVVDSDNQTALPFVNIGIKQKNIGTSSLADGTFSIIIPMQNENDTLTFSMVGYTELNLPIKNIIEANPKIFQLKTKTTALQPVVITANKLVEQKFGIKKNGGLIHITDGSTNQNDIFGIKKIYPTKQGGREWFMNMTDPKNDPNIDFTYDPHLIKQNDSSWKFEEITDSTSTLTINTIEYTVSMDDIYDEVKF